MHFPELSTGKAAGGGLEWARHMYDMTFAPRYQVWQQEEWLPSDRAGVGYLLIGGQGGGGGQEGGAPGPLVMPLQKLGLVLRRQQGQLRHACARCLAGAARAAAGLVMAGEACQAPFCARKPEGGCGCCDGGFCRGCLTGGGYGAPEAACEHGRWPVVYSQAPGRLAEAGAAFSTAERYPPGGLCMACGGERAHALKAAATAVFEQDYAARLARVAGPGGAVHAVPAAARLTAGGRLKEARKSRAAAAGYAAEIARRAADLAAGPCRRGRPAAPGGGYPPHTGYVLVGPPG
ncbi:MAG TPA: hypothetical protein VH478_07745 [Trebonia sp.]|nr:hypothetical protein [Trebonia sp.]